MNRLDLVTLILSGQGPYRGGLFLLKNGKCPITHSPHLHGQFNFTEVSCETVAVSCLPSCGSRFSGQGISLGQPLERIL